MIDLLMDQQMIKYAKHLSTEICANLTKLGLAPTIDAIFIYSPIRFGLTKDSIMQCASSSINSSLPYIQPDTLISEYFH